jgi:hypothetical protein
MNAVTIRAGGDVRVAGRKRLSVDAGLIGVVNRAVTLSTSQRDIDPSFRQELACALIRDPLLGVRVMAVTANRSIGIPCGNLILVDTVQSLPVLVGMTILAGGVKLELEIAWAGGSHFRMWEPRDVRMAVYAGDIFCPMHGSFESSGIDRDGKRLPPDLSSHTLLLVASQTGFVGGLLTLRWRGGFSRRGRENHDHKEKEHSQSYASQS